MYLAPHHFQAQRRHVEDTVVRTVDALVPFAYGVTAVALDAEALAGGTLAVDHVHGVLPDGTVVAVPESDPKPEAVSLATHFSPDRDAHVVHLVLPAWREDAANVRLADRGAVTGSGWGTNGNANGSADDTRFDETTTSVRDETSGLESAPVRFAIKRLRLALDSEISPSDVTLPLARLRRDGAGHFVVDPDFVPPALRIGGSERLMSILRNVVGMLEAKGGALAASMSIAPTPAGGVAPAAYVGNELATRWLLHAVRSAEGPLRHLLHTRRSHPEHLWSELSRLAGALCTFSLTTQARDLPPYDHDDLGGCFASLERHLQEHLDVVIASRAVVIPLAKATDLLYVATINDPRCFEPGTRWFLGVRSSLGAAETALRAPQMLKVCARKFVLELVRRAFPGMDITHVPAPPPALAPRPELTYFEITLAGPCAQGLRDTQEVGVYVPDAVPGAVLELAIVVAG